MFDGKFAEFIAASQRLLGFTDLDMARLLHVPVPTIDRYRRNVASPHPLVQTPMYNAVLKALSQKYSAVTS